FNCPFQEFIRASVIFCLRSFQIVLLLLSLFCIFPGILLDLTLLSRFRNFFLFPFLFWGLPGFFIRLYLFSSTFAHILCTSSFRFTNAQRHIFVYYTENL